MALKQTDQNQYRQYIASPKNAGERVRNVFQADLSAGFLAADILEIAAIPARARLAQVTVASTGLTGTIAVSVLTGTYGKATTSTGAERTAASQLIAAASTAADTSVPLGTMMALAPTEDHRSIGLAFSANVTAGAGKTVMVAVDFYL